MKMGAQCQFREVRVFIFMQIITYKYLYYIDKSSSFENYYLSLTFLGVHGIPYVTVQAGQKIRLQCQSNPAHITPKLNSASEEKTATFLWSVNDR